MATQHVEGSDKLPPTPAIKQHHAELYLEALEQYSVDESINKNDEIKLRRKLDRRILPMLGICYFFYVSSCPAHLRCPSYPHF
jgi:hypothetical protein